MSRSAESLKRYRDAAAEHLEWCASKEIHVLGGRWDLENPISGLILASIAQPSSAESVLSALCSESFSQVRVTSVWWPSKLVDLIVNFEANGERHSLYLEHKHLNSPSNQPGYKTSGGEYWQTESMLREIERVRCGGEEVILGGPFDPTAKEHLVVLDARGREMCEIFELGDDSQRHRHEVWRVLSYMNLVKTLRERYEVDADAGLVPLLAQLFASERQ